MGLNGCGKMIREARSVRTRLHPCRKLPQMNPGFPPLEISVRRYGLAGTSPYSRWIEARIGTSFLFTLPGLYLDLSSDSTAGFSSVGLSQWVTTGSEAFPFALIVSTMSQGLFPTDPNAVFP